MAAWGALRVCTTTQTSGLPVEIHTLLKAKRSGTDKHEVLKHIKNTTTREQFSILEAQTARGWKGVLEKKNHACPVMLSLRHVLLVIQAGLDGLAQLGLLLPSRSDTSQAP